jgi:hypothetical protein
MRRAIIRFSTGFCGVSVSLRPVFLSLCFLCLYLSRIVTATVANGPPFVILKCDYAMTEISHQRHSARINK